MVGKYVDLCVYYGVRDPFGTPPYWTHKTFPSGWFWLNEDLNYHAIYKHVERFRGPAENIESMCNYLERHYTRLKIANIVSKFIVVGEGSP